LQQQTAWASILEILVVGQHTEDSLPSFPKVRYIPIKERPTAARNRNLGAAQARGTWICFIDSDCVPAPDWIEQMIQATMTLNARVFYGHVTIPLDTSYWGRCDHRLVFGACPRPVPHVVKSAATLNFCIERELFAEIGAFDESFPFAAGEDLDLCYRLCQAGNLIYFVPAASVEHRHNRQTWATAWVHIQRYGEATAQFRLLRGMDWRWRLMQWTSGLPALGELFALLRTLARTGVRGGQYLVCSPDNLKEIPGIALLDLAHALGIVHYLRRIREDPHG
jgi:GT2 family glycosyltransferase